MSGDIMQSLTVMWLVVGYIHATIVPVAVPVQLCMNVACDKLFASIGAHQLTGKMQQSKTHKACSFFVQLLHKNKQQA